MAVAGEWEELSDQLHEALRWAQAIEVGDDVGTRSLLIGMMRANAGRSDPDELLQAFDIPPEKLFGALQEVAPHARIDPHVARPSVQQDELVPTRNLAQALSIAATLRPEHQEGLRIAPSHVFGAMLRLPSCTAYRGLALAIGDALTMDRLARIHDDYREVAYAVSFHDLLREHLGRRRLSREREAVVAPRDLGALSLSPDGTLLAGARADGGVELWDVADLQQMRALEQIRGTAEEATALALSADGETLAAAYGDGTAAALRRGRPSDWLTLRRAGPPNRLLAVAVSADGGRVVGADAAGWITIWDADAPAIGRLFRASAEPVSAIAFVDGAGAVVTFDAAGAVRRWDLEQTTSESLATVGPGPWLQTAFAPDGRTLALLPADGRLRIFDVEHGSEQTFAVPFDLHPRSIALSAEGRVAFAGADGSLGFTDPAPNWPPDRREERLDRVEWLSDARAREDLLGRAQLARALAKRLDRMSAAAPEESFLLHLDGPWGAGKSSILHFMRAELDPHWLIVDFDAWRQSRVGPPWWALLTSLRRALRAPLGGARGTALRVREAAARVRRDHIVLPFALLAALAAVVWLLLTPASSEVRAAVAAGAALVSGLAVLLGPGRGLAAFLMWDSAMGARRYEQWHRDPMEGLADHFAWLVARAPRPVVFFVDDLDRCDERHVVDLLDSIQTLVRDAGGSHAGARAPCFVVAADGRWIRRSYERTHEGFETAVGEPGRPLGYLFLDKLFQLTVDVPEIGADRQSGYLRRLLTGPHGEPAQAGGAAPAPAAERVERSTSEREILAAVQEASPQERAAATAAAVKKLSDPQVERVTEHELQRYAGLLERNPRSMKRFVNAYSMALSTMLLEGRRVEPEELALWTILRLRWPDLARRLREQPAELAAFAGADAAAPVPAELAGLVGAPELVHVVGFGDAGLSDAAVRRLTGHRPARG